MNLEFIHSYREYNIKNKKVIILGEVHGLINNRCLHHDHADISNIVKRMKRRLSSENGLPTELLLEYNPEDSSVHEFATLNMNKLSNIKHTGIDKRIKNCTRKLYRDLDLDLETFEVCLEHLGYLIEKESKTTKIDEYFDKFLEERLVNFRNMKLFSKKMNNKDPKDLKHLLYMLQHEYAYMSDYYIIEKMLTKNENYIILIGLEHAEHLHKIFRDLCVKDNTGETCIKLV